MLKILVGILLVFSLLLAPVAHAAETTCQDFACQIVQQSGDTANQDSGQDNGKLALAGHACFCAHVSVLNAPDYVVSAFTALARNSLAIGKDDRLAAFIVAPLSEPPSYA